MKKKILSLVLALLMAGGSAGMVAADETAAAGESAYASAVEFLHSYGIYKGESAENLAADEDIERYQMALFVARISTGWVEDSKWEDGPQDTSGFTDINDGEEASAYLGAISYASQKGIIEGYGNGEFGPYDGITYQDALTMVVRTLGYQGLDWPWGYIEKAVELGLTDGIVDVAYTDILTRGEVAMVIYNALFADKNGGSTLAADIFGMSDWTPIVITASDRAIYEKGGELVPGSDVNAQNVFVSFKIFDPATGKIAEATKDEVYYAVASDLGLDAAKWEDDMAVGATYWVIFKQEAGKKFAEILEYQDTVVDTIWNLGKTDDEGNAAAYAVNAYLADKTPVTKYTPANYINSTKYTQPEIMLFDAVEGIVELEAVNNGSLLAVDMKTGDILVKIADDAVAYDYKAADGTKYNVLWYWNNTVNKYFQYVKTANNGIIGIKWMTEGDLKAEDYIDWSEDKVEVAYTGMKVLTALPETSAYASLVLEDVDGLNGAERAFYEEYSFGKIVAATVKCPVCDADVAGYNVMPATNLMYTGEIDAEGAFSSKGTIYGNIAVPGCAHGAFFAEGYELKNEGYVVYSFDSETKEIKVVKEILDKANKTDADSYVDYGVLRAYSTTQEKVIIGDTVYTANYDELKGTGFLKVSDNKSNYAVGLDSMLNQYVEFVLVDGEVVSMNLVGVAADSAYLIVKEYAGMTNDGYIAVEAYDAKTGKLGVYCIASYNGWKQGDYYYYLTEEKVRESFTAGAMYYIKSYDKNEDVYNVELIGNYNDNGRYVVDGNRLSLAATTVTFANDGYRIVNNEASVMSADDTYIILADNTDENAQFMAPIFYHKGKVVDTTWTVTGERIADIGGAIVIVNATNVVGFDLDKYDAGMYLYEGGKVIEAAYDSTYAEIFESAFIEGRYIVGATTYKVEALNLYTGVREDVLVDRNIDLVKGHIYITVSGKLIEEVKPAADGEFALVNAANFLALMSEFYYMDRNIDVKYAATADYLFGSFVYDLAGGDITNDYMDGILAEDGWYEFKRARVSDVVAILVEYAGATMTVTGYDNIADFIAANPNALALDCAYVYDVDTGKAVVYANKIAVKEEKEWSKAIVEDVNDVAGVDLVMTVNYINYYDVDGELVKAEINNVKFEYTGAKNMRHNDRAAAGLGFGHLSDHVLGSYLDATCGLYVADDLYVDLYTKGTANVAIEYETWVCDEYLCDIVKSINFNLKEMDKVITVTSATDAFDLLLTLKIKPSVADEDAVIEGVLGGEIEVLEAEWNVGVNVAYTSADLAMNIAAETANENAFAAINPDAIQAGASN